MNKLHVALLVGALVVVPTLLAAPATANSCTSQTVIFSRNSNAPVSVNANALVCLAKNTAGLTDPDTAFINPGSDRVQVRYTANVGEEYLLANVEGLGLDQTIVLAYTLTTTGSWVYDSTSLAIDPAATGTITATVYLADGETEIDQVTFRTVA